MRMDKDELESRLARLEQAIARLSDELEQERKVNTAQQQAITARIQGQEWLEVPTVGAIAFVLLLLIGVLSLRIQLPGVEFIPGEVIIPLLEKPAIAAVITALVAALTKKYNSQQSP